jgi:hypothetical protein
LSVYRGCSQRGAALMRRRDPSMQAAPTASDAGACRRR